MLKTSLPTARTLLPPSHPNPNPRSGTPHNVCNVIPPPGTDVGIFAGAKVPPTFTTTTKMTEYTLPVDCHALAQTMLTALMANISPAKSTYDGKAEWAVAYLACFDLECAAAVTALVSPPLSPFHPPSNAHTSDRFERSHHSCNSRIFPTGRSGTTFWEASSTLQRSANSHPTPRPQPVLIAARCLVVACLKALMALHNKVNTGGSTHTFQSASLPGSEVDKFSPEQQRQTLCVPNHLLTRTPPPPPFFFLLLLYLLFSPLFLFFFPQ